MRLAFDLNARPLTCVAGCGLYFQQMKLKFEMRSWGQTGIQGERQKGPLVVNLAFWLTLGNQNSR
jgi:hypothetical protein